MKKGIKILLLAAAMLPTATFAQLSSNPDKFLGNITTGNSEMDHDGFIFSDYWNQVTPENATKWQSVEGTRGVYNWGGADNAANYAKKHNFPFKFHTFIWGSQYPGWIKDLSLAERYDAIVKWMDAAKEHYPYLQVMDVANECIQGHQDDTSLFKDALGGGGKTGYDWLIKAFEMASERWPDAILVYNDFNVLRWDKDKFIDLLRALRDAGAPIDAYGCQAHHFTLNDISKSELQSNMNSIQTSVKMPMYITEYDISFADDAQQKTKYQEQIPLFWEADYCAGVTLWGWFLGATWAENTGLIRNRQERAALQWLREYMQKDVAKNAKSPYPGMKKEASIYIRPAALKVAKGDVLPIKVRARMATKTIEKIDLYAGNDLIATMTSEPYMAEYTASSTGIKNLKAVVTTTDGSTYERLSRIQVLSSTTKREPFNETVPLLPGTIKAEEFDKGASSVSYYNVTRTTDSPIKTNSNSWMEYTVDVAEDGLYTMDMEVASSNANGLFHLSEYGFDNLTFYTNMTAVPNTGGATEYLTLHCPMTQPLTAGRHVFCLNVDKGNFYVKNLTFNLIPTFTMPGTIAVKDMVRCEGVEVKTTSAGYVLGMDNADWAEYSVDVTLNNNKYSYEITASSVEGASVSMTLIDSDGNEKSLGTVSIPATGSLDTYAVKTGKIRNKLDEGKQTLRVTLKSGSCDIASLNITNSEATGIDELSDDDTVATGETYNLSGQKVGAGYKGIVIRNGKKYVER